MVETKYSRTISLTGSSIEFLKPHRQQQSIKMKHISQNDMVISFWFYSNKTTKLAIKQKKRRHPMLIPTLAIIIKMKRTVNPKPMPFWCKNSPNTKKNTHSHTNRRIGLLGPMEDLRLSIENSIFLVEHNGTNNCCFVCSHLNVKPYYDVVTVATMSLNEQQW